MALRCATSTQCLLHPFPSLSLKISPHCLIDKIDDSFSLSANQASFVESPPYFSIRKESRRIARILSRCMWEEERQQLSNGGRVSDGISRLWQKCPRVTSSERVTLHSIEDIVRPRSLSSKFPPLLSCLFDFKQYTCYCPASSHGESFRFPRHPES